MGPRDHSAQPRAELTRREDQALCCPGAAWPNEEAMASNCFIPTKMLRVALGSGQLFYQQPGGKSSFGSES